MTAVLHSTIRLYSRWCGYVIGGAVLLSPCAMSHPLDLGFLQMALQGSTVSATLDLNPQLASALQGRDGGIGKLFSATLGSGPLALGGMICEWQAPEGHPVGQSFRVAAVAHCPTASGQLEWRFPFLKSTAIPRTFQLLVKADFGGNEEVFTLKGDADRIASSIARRRSFVDFIQMGIQHIGATPSEWYGPTGFHLPDGLDHIFFLLALILAGGGLLELVKTATGFTVGHSVTLALATLNLVHLPSRLVESAIALSIAYVALESLIVAEPRHRWRLAAFFGLVHGFGFASALSELHLTGSSLAQALVGFNLGVEIGQVIIVSLLFPLLFLASRRARVRFWVVKTAAAFVFVVGTCWFFERALGAEPGLAMRTLNRFLAGGQ